MRKIPLTVLALAILVGVCGCGPTYYRVTDPTTKRAYYTTEMKDKGAGSVQLHDASTGRTITLQNSEVEKVTKEEFETGKVRATIADPNAHGGSAPH
jgi:hypothetical protein